MQDAEPDDEIEEQDFLFFLDEAYTQDNGEWQVSLSVGYFDNLREGTAEDEQAQHSDLWIGLLGVEYGITDRLQVEFELPYLRLTVHEDETARDSGIGDLEFAVGYALIEETDESPQLTAGLEIIAPTGDESAGLGTGTWGWGPFLALSKQVSGQWYLHANLAFQISNNVEEDGERFDERELEYGLAAVYQPTDNVDLILELVGAYERAQADEGTEHGRVLQLAPGIKYEFENGLEVGVAAAFGLTDDTYDSGVLVKLQYEF